MGEFINFIKSGLITICYILRYGPKAISKFDEKTKKIKEESDEKIKYHIRQIRTECQDFIEKIKGENSDTIDDILTLIDRKLTREEKQEVLKNPGKYFVMIDIRLSEYTADDIKGLPVFADGKDTIEFRSPMWSKLLEKKLNESELYVTQSYTYYNLYFVIMLVLTALYIGNNVFSIITLILLILIITVNTTIFSCISILLLLFFLFYLKSNE